MTTPVLRAAAAALVLTAPLVATFAAHAATPAGKVVFTRTALAADATASSRSLWILDLGNGQVRQLTTPADRTFDMAATWSPDGQSLVFDRGTTRARMDSRHVLETMTPDATRPKLLLSGVGDFSKPAWGPNNRIAFIRQDSVRAAQCVSLVDGTGRIRRTLYCPAAPIQLMRPTWSADGTHLFVAAGYPEGRLEPVWHALAYSIDVATGGATLLSDIVMEEQLDLEFSPDGTRGVYSDSVANDMTLVDFRTGEAKALPRGHAPKWSPDGRRIAYTGEVYEVGTGEFRYYEPLYVINADGTRVRRITDSRVDNHAYTAAQWSKDNVHLLVNRRTFDDVSLTIPRFGLRIIDADTRALVNLPAGYAETGGWFEP
ncbi:hypothetical protein LYSHEL_25620 [Lysobacter helvus]|uniref:WD40 repeat protein n=2 Tax=Lysobacteraceae TaxID=32033 RepID=A0ABN6G1A3_9GAMM|nr:MULTISPECIES: PD40 domain-containing protein [Lysobacter]BCT93538.1 hypothetical protein LYSCAS_25620 [Lysobacter caseinilyticus]BCT96691.1 hypothetical protein LYSHEL_25620 [Lysobacter helvus]